jgi:hypothetical protein
MVTARSPKPKVRKARRDRGSTRPRVRRRDRGGSVRERRDGETVGHRRLSISASNSV